MPQVLFIYPSYDWYPPLTSIKVKSENLSSTISSIKKEWEKFSSAGDFNYYFLDESFDKLYESEQNLSEILIYISSLTIFIACLG
jgi:putative ABC transport system permease protein